MLGRKKVEWRWDMGIYVPFCPYCNELAYDKKKCCFCGKKYKWVEGEIHTTEVMFGPYKIIQTSNNNIQIYKNGRLVMHSSCTKKMTGEELIKQVELYEFLR